MLQLLDRQLSLKEICYSYFVSNEKDVKLLKHAKIIKTLKLNLLVGDQPESVPVLWNLSEFVNLEKFSLLNIHSSGYNFKNIIENSKNCPNLTDKLGKHIHISKKGLYLKIYLKIFILQNIVVIHLMSGLLYCLCQNCRI